MGPQTKLSQDLQLHTVAYLLFICCRDMTEVFTGLPEQDILLAEFFLEKFLWKHTVKEVFFFPSVYVISTGDHILIFPVLLLLRPVERADITGCNVTRLV